MANLSLHVLCILLAIGHFSVGNLVLDVKPDIITPGVTSDLTVNCSVTYSYQSGISSIISLVISKAESKVNQTGPFSDVISINVFTNQVISKENTNAVASGNIDSNTLDAFLSLSWSSPSQAESGFYRCDANFLDNFGHPVDISTSAEVTSSKPGLDGLTKIVETLRADLASAKSDLDKWIQTNDALASTLVAQNSTIAAKTSKIIELEEQLKNNSETTDLQTMPDKLVSLLQASIAKNQTYNGHLYILPEIILGNLDLAEYFCSRYQGYVVEVEDEQERQFLVNFLDSEHVTWLILGATQGAQSGQWVYRHSDRPVTLSGSVREPSSDSGGNCTVKYISIAVYASSITAFMYDVTGTCVNTHGFKFVCEVPEN